MFSPEDLAFLDYSGGVAPYNEQDRAIQQQLAQAYALRNQQPQQHSTGAGALMGGLGGIIRQGTSYAQEKNLRGQDQALQANRTAQMQALIDALRKQQQPMQQQGIPPMLMRPGQGAGY